ncbi:hypothetical protein NKR23_g11891 [Pleurostoma richardsiae]|uniref:Uncharacterized protein n=1 Tax=Pleurostoma richardsiae TaxID=41990 RepID=A0AA38VGR7_9PEZI|nr:hypothetical protein NKR23_g11891 [Pleurostoma richardsiae]
MLKNLGATEAEVKGLLSDGPVTGMDKEASLVMQACDEITLKGAIQDPTMKRMKEKVPLESEEEIDEKIGRSTRPA